MKFNQYHTKSKEGLPEKWTSGFQRAFSQIKAEMRRLYFKDDRPWIVSFSSGKDSTLVLTLVWEMLQSLPKTKRRKTIYVVGGDTKAEEPRFASFFQKSLSFIESAAKSEKLPIEVRRSRPEIKESAFYKVIGKGFPLPSPASRFRWCTDSLKIRPNERVIDTIIPKRKNTKNEYDAYMLTGVRRAESSHRAASIERYSIGNRFARHSTRSMF